MKNRLLLFILSAVLAVGLATVAFSQETTTGYMEGKVVDETGKPIANAIVTVAGPQGAKTAITDEKGYYLIPFLKVGDYDVKAEAPGYATVVQSDVLIKMNSRTQLPFTLPKGKVETITVSAQAAMIDAKQTSTGAVINVGDFADYVPIPRSYMGLFSLSPGVVDGGQTGVGNYSISGSSGLENSYLIDGVNITNTGYGGVGAYNIVFGSLGTGVTTDFLDQVQVKTGGFEAEYGQALGGVVNSIVKSGGNEFHGNVGAYITPSSTEGSREWVRTITGAVNRREQDIYDLAASAGGPIMKDKLFYFVAYNPIQTSDYFIAPDTRWPADVPDRPYNEGDLIFAMADKGLQERERRNDNYAAKLTWYVVPNHRVELTAFGDPSKGKAGPQRSGSLLYDDFLTLGGGQSEVTYGGNNYSLKYDAVFTPNFFMEFMLGMHDAEFEETDSLLPTDADGDGTITWADEGDNPGWRYRDQRGFFDWYYGDTAYPVRTYSGGAGFVSNSKDKNQQYSLKFTNVIGNHEIKWGASFDDIEYTDVPTYSGKNIDLPLPLDSNNDGVYDSTLVYPSTSGAYVDIRGSWLTPWYRITRVRLQPDPPPTKSEEWGFFATDTWAIHPRFNLKLGVRWSQQELSGSNTFTLGFAQDPDTGLIINGSTDYNPASYKFDAVIAPRVGFTWDIFGTGKDKVYGNYAQYYERVPNDLAVRQFSNEVGLTQLNFTDKDLTTRRNNTVYWQGLTTTRVETGTKLPYVEEILLGYSKQVTPDFSIETRAIFRKQGRVLEDVQYTALESIQNFYYGTSGYGYDGSGYPFDPFPGFDPGPFATYVLANPGENTPGSAGFTKPVRDYKALEIIANKRFSNNWMFYGTYRFAKLIGNYEGLFRNDNGQSDPNITSLFDFPNSYMMRGQFNEGFLNTDRAHVLNLYTSYLFPIGLTVGGSFSWQTGVPRTPMLAHPNYQNAGEIPGYEPTYYYWAWDGEGFDLRETSDLGTYFSDPEAWSWIFLKDYREVPRGFLGRTPDLATFGLHFGYTFKIQKTDLNLALDISNLFNSQAANDYVDDVEYQAGLGEPNFLLPEGYQAPRTVRATVRWAW